MIKGFYEDPEGVASASGGALSRLLHQDVDLFASDCHEIAFVHRFAVYLELSINPDVTVVSPDFEGRLPAGSSEDLGFQGHTRLSIDLEYNRDGLERPKRLHDNVFSDDASASGPLFGPDLIVHHRGDGESNMLISEWKTAKPTAWARRKATRRSALLERTQRIMRQFGYQYGLAVDVRLWEPRIQWCLLIGDGVPFTVNHDDGGPWVVA